ncbi:GNAT family N-acetyltransferase [Salinispirillum sp. LH 10-3-1]|uniref:GNAT family N-acetyltransferase n=1 Tax=Salinispirillum sp. LH 10-3-1 TaxID=2952525 RepID=A0AB38YEX1_9GAMM
MTEQLNTPRLRLQRACEEHAEALQAYVLANRGYLQPWEPAREAEYYSLSHCRQRLRHMQSEAEHGRALSWMVHPAGESRIVATVQLTGITRGFFQATYLGYGLDQTMQGQGYMHEALQAVLTHAFTELKLHRVIANYMPRNHRSAAVLERLGFLREGLAQRYLKINGQWEDHVLTSLIAEDWQRLQQDAHSHG